MSGGVCGCQSGRRGRWVGEWGAGIIGVRLEWGFGVVVVVLAFEVRRMRGDAPRSPYETIGTHPPHPTPPHHHHHPPTQPRASRRDAVLPGSTRGTPLCLSSPPARGVSAPSYFCVKGGAMGPRGVHPPASPSSPAGPGNVPAPGRRGGGAARGRAQPLGARGARVRAAIPRGRPGGYAARGIVHARA